MIQLISYLYEIIFRLSSYKSLDTPMAKNYINSINIMLLSEKLRLVMYEMSRYGTYVPKTNLM